ncbi:MAG: hypothetical protein ACLFU3_09635, partial [Dichotomicrobium sp.]
MTDLLWDALIVAGLIALAIVVMELAIRATFGIAHLHEPEGDAVSEETSSTARPKGVLSRRPGRWPVPGRGCDREEKMNEADDAKMRRLHEETRELVAKAAAAPFGCGLDIVKQSGY